MMQCREIQAWYGSRGPEDTGRSGAQERDTQRWLVQDSALDTLRLTSGQLIEMQTWTKLVLGVTNKKELVPNI